MGHGYFWKTRHDVHSGATESHPADEDLSSGTPDSSIRRGSHAFADSTKAAKMAREKALCV
jgi:hypothetical protein